MTSCTLRLSISYSTLPPITSLYPSILCSFFRPKAANLSPVPFWSTWSQEPWIQSALAHLDSYSGLTTLSLVSEQKNHGVTSHPEPTGSYIQHVCQQLLSYPGKLCLVSRESTAQYCIFPAQSFCSPSAMCQECDVLSMCSCVRLRQLSW